MASRRVEWAVAGALAGWAAARLTGADRLRLTEAWAVAAAAGGCPDRRGEPSRDTVPPAARGGTRAAEAGLARAGLGDLLTIDHVLTDRRCAARLDLDPPPARQ